MIVFKGVLGEKKGVDFMDMKSLNYFVHAAENLNFTKAAKECYISQTAISLSIAKMEEELGFMLFERNNRSIRLTPAGRDFYEWACRTLHSYEQAVQSGRNISTGYSGVIRIGFSSTFEGLWFIPYLKSFRKQFSDVRLEQRIMDADVLIEALQNKDIDAVVAPPCEYYSNKNVVIQHLAHFPMILVMNKNHPLAKYEQVPVELLSDQIGTILTYENQPRGGRHFVESCRQYGIHFKELRQLDRLEEILLRLVDGFEVAFLPSLVEGYLNDFVIARPLRDCDMHLTFSFCYLKSNKNPSLHALSLALQQKYALWE